MWTNIKSKHSAYERQYLCMLIENLPKTNGMPNFVSELDDKFNKPLGEGCGIASLDGTTTVLMKQDHLGHTSTEKEPHLPTLSQDENLFDGLEELPSDVEKMLLKDYQMDDFWFPSKESPAAAAEFPMRNLLPLDPVTAQSLETLTIVAPDAGCQQSHGTTLQVPLSTQEVNVPTFFAQNKTSLGITHPTQSLIWSAPSAPNHSLSGLSCIELQTANRTNDSLLHAILGQPYDNLSNSSQSALIHQNASISTGTDVIVGGDQGAILQGETSTGTEYPSKTGLASSLPQTVVSAHPTSLYNLRKRKRVKYKGSCSEIDDQAGPALADEDDEDKDENYTCAPRRIKKCHRHRTVHTQTDVQDHIQSDSDSNTLPKPTLARGTVPLGVGGDLVPHMMSHPELLSKQATLLAATPSSPVMTPAPCDVNMLPTTLRKPALSTGQGSTTSTPAPSKDGVQTFQKSDVKAMLGNKIKMRRVQNGQQPMVVEFTPRPSGELTEEEKEKVARRKRRNVLSAQKSRQDRRNLMEELEKEVTLLEMENRKQVTEKESLERELLEVTAMLEDHKKVCRLNQDPVSLKTTGQLQDLGLALVLCQDIPTADVSLTAAGPFFNTWDSQTFE